MDWQETTINMINLDNELMISDTELLFLALESSVPHNFHMYKLTFGSVPVDWANKILWPTSSWNSASGDSILNSDHTIMNILFLYGDSSTMFAHFWSLSTSSGSTIGSRYISSLGWTFIESITQINNYLIASIRTTDEDQLVVFDTTSSSFVYRKFRLDIENNCLLDHKSLFIFQNIWTPFLQK